MCINGDGCDLLILQRTILCIGLGACDGIDNLKAGSDLAECSVLAIQMGCIFMHHKELAACGVGGLAPSHGQNATLMLQIVLHTVEEELTLDAVAGATHAGAFGAAALDHEAGDDTVEDQAVIKIMIAQLNEVLPALGCDRGIQFALDHGAVFHSDLKSRIHA